MTNTLTISRKLIEEVVTQLDDFITGEVLDQLKSILAAPVVERQEPVAWMYKRTGGEILGQLVQLESDALKDIRLGKCYDTGNRYLWPREDYIEWKPLYTSPPAPVAVVSDLVQHLESVIAMFAPGEDKTNRTLIAARLCLDKVKELNQ